MRILLAPLLFAAGCALAADPKPSVPQQITDGVWLIPEVPTADREPDGNTIVFRAPSGLIVMDTGRHAWHRQAILDFAASSHQPIVAVINSHWHLDHVSGNPTLIERYPRLKVYSSDAIDGALKRFLAEGEHRSDQYLNDPNIPEATKDDIRADRETIKQGSGLRPDVVIRKSGDMKIAGRTLSLNLAVNAATAGDVWVYDAHTKIAAVGDLVTLPSPYLDTACPDGWREALSNIEMLPFEKAVPGHGPVMSRADLSQYHHAFDSFIECARSQREKKECASEWSQAVAKFLPQPNGAAEAQEQEGAAYYTDMLRANGGQSKYCEAPKKA